MQVLFNIESVIRDEKSSVTLGTFDGLHFAHQKIVKRTLEEAKNNNGRSVVVTFNTHPKVVIDNTKTQILLLTNEEKIKLIQSLNLSPDILLILNFDKELSNMSYVKFFEKIILEKIGVKNLILGYDHSFGFQREGGLQYLDSVKSKYNFDLQVIEEVILQGEAVKSTSIRQFLLEGKIEQANLLLGWNYSISGLIVEGLKRGRTIGFPTANINVNDPLKIIPKNGVYLVKVKLDNGNYFGFVNIGFCPTFESNNKMSIEVNIFDFNEDIYGRNITIEFIEYIREEIKFNSVDELKKQISNDKEICLIILNNKK